jgi:predicted ATPase
MLTRFTVRNYKALRDISLELTPIHVLIGPNDSGKTSILNALAALSRSTDQPLPKAFDAAWDGRELVWHGDAQGVIYLTADLAVGDDKLQYSLACRFPNSGTQVRVERETITRADTIDCGQANHKETKVRGVFVNNADAPEEMKRDCRLIHESLFPVHYFRWNARMLALPVAPDTARQFRLNTDGFGLALLLDDILGFDRNRFIELEARFCSLFPDFSSIKLQRQMAYRSPPDDGEQVSKLDRADGKGLYFELGGNRQLVPASQASDGTLLVLGYLALLLSPHPPRLLLIEEPENGIHPKRLQDVLGILGELASAQSLTQILLTTHSPYAVDSFKPEQVTLCTKSDDGTVELTRMSTSKAVREQESLFTLGEIWTAEGDNELARGQTVSSP